MKFLATINVPGYLPMDDDPPTFDTAREAWAWLADERVQGEDAAFDADLDTDEGYSSIVNTMESLGNGTLSFEEHDLCGVASTGEGTIWGETPGYDGDHDLGLNYCVSIVESHHHYVVDISKTGGPDDSFIHAGVSLWTQSRDEVHEFIAEGKEKGFALSHRIIGVEQDWPTSECECAHSSPTQPTIQSSSRAS